MHRVSYTVSACAIYNRSEKDIIQITCLWFECYVQAFLKGISLHTILLKKKKDKDIVYCFWWHMPAVIIPMPDIFDMLILVNGREKE